MLEERELKKENDIIKAQALPTSKPKEPANLPNEFITNDDFCPGCGLELRSMTDRAHHALERCLPPEPRSGRCAREAGTAGAAALPGWGLEQQLSGDRRALVEGLRKDIEAMEKALPPKYAYVHGVRDMETATDLQVHLRGNPMRLGDAVPRGFLSVLGNPAERVTVHEGQRPARAGRSHRRAARSPLRVIVNRVWKGHFGTGLVDTPSNFGVNGERPTIPSCWTIWRSTSSTTACRSRSCTARSC